MATQQSYTRILSDMDRYCRQQFALCSTLEEIADALPDNVDSQVCLQVAKLLYPTIKTAHEFEETQLFPALEELKSDKPEIDASIERLRYEHWEDEAYAQDLSEVLLAWVDGDRSKDPEAVGYMLRGFFDGLRRHIAFEHEHILPLVRSLADQQNLAATAGQ